MSHHTLWLSLKWWRWNNPTADTDLTLELTLSPVSKARIATCALNGSEISVSHKAHSYVAGIPAL